MRTTSIVVLLAVLSAAFLTLTGAVMPVYPVNVAMFVDHVHYHAIVQALIATQHAVEHGLAFSPLVYSGHDVPAAEQVSMP